MSSEYFGAQRTLAEDLCIEGVGLHTGASVQVRLAPAPTGQGIRFIRTTPDGQTHEIPALIDYVTDSRLATTIGLAGVANSSVSTIEHLMAALHALQIDNCFVFVDGPEIPILDGSARLWVQALLDAGTVEQRAKRKLIRIKKKVRVEDTDGKWAEFRPARKLSITCSLDFSHPLITNTPLTMRITPKQFIRAIAPARTFGFLEDVRTLQHQGLAQGGSLENAIVIDQFKILNPEGLRFADEFARHKLLDAIGDFALAGHALVGHIVMHRSGHALNAKLLRALFQNANSYEMVEVPADNLGATANPMPGTGRLESIEVQPT